MGFFMNVGDFLFKKENDGLYYIYQIIAIEENGDIFHVSVYKPLKKIPKVPYDLILKIHLIPISASSFKDYTIFSFIL